MVFSNVDFISPPNILYCKGKETHRNLASGLLSVLVIIAAFTFSVLFFLEFINKKNPTAYFYNKYQGQVGTFPFNSSAMYGFINVGTKKIDFKAVTIFSTYKYITDYYENQDLSEFEHWKFGPCEKSDADPKLPITNMSLFLEAACIKEFWNVEKQQYFTKNEEGFEWPAITDVQSFTHTYGIYVERCKNNTGRVLNKEDCYEESLIDEYIIEAESIRLYSIDHYIDVSNYSDPAVKFFSMFSTGMFSETFSINHLNYNPVKIKTNKGLVFDDIIEELTFLYFQNEKITMTTGSTKILSNFSFWVQNNVQIYERAYKKLQDILGSIGGIFQILYAAGKFINTIFHGYQVIIDSITIHNSLIKNQKAKSFGDGSKICLNSSKANKKISLSIFPDKSKNTSKNLFDKSSCIIQNLHLPKIQKPSFLLFLYSFYFHCKKRYKSKTITERFSTLRREILSEEFLFNMYYTHVKFGDNQSFFKLKKSVGKVKNYSNIISSTG